MAVLVAHASVETSLGTATTTVRAQCNAAEARLVAATACVIRVRVPAGPVRASGCDKSPDIESHVRRVFGESKSTRWCCQLLSGSNAMRNGLASEALELIRR